MLHGKAFRGRTTTPRASGGPGALAATGIRPGQPRAAALTGACLARRVTEPGEMAARETIAGCGCWPVVKVIGEAGRVKGRSGCSG